MIRGKIKKFLKIEGGNSGLTEDFIYLNQPKDLDNEITVYSSSTQESTSLRKIDKNAKINNKDIKLFSGEGITVARNGKAGNMIYLKNENYTMNDHAYCIQVRDNYKDKINIRYIMVGLKQEVENCITSDKKGNRTFNKTLFDETIVNIPEISKQEEVIKEYERLYRIKDCLETNINKISIILNTIPKCDMGDLHKIDEVFYLMSEDRRMTEEYIYNHYGKYPVYSAQINGAYGYIDSYNYEGEILSVVNYGDSGKTTIREGKLTIGRNACGLIPKEEYKEKVSLKYAKYALQSVLVNNAKGADLKSLSQETIKATEFFLPDIKEQEIIADEYGKIEKILYMLNKMHEKVTSLLN